MSHTKPVATTIGLLTGLSLVVAGGDADALTMTQMDGFSLSAGTGFINGPVMDQDDTTLPMETDAFNLFNPALGTLTGVKFTFDTESASAGFNLQVQEGSGTVTGDGALDADFFATVSGPLPDTGAVLNQILTAGFSLMDSCMEMSRCTASESGSASGAPFDATFTVMGVGNIASFVGPGTFDVKYTLPIAYDQSFTGEGAILQGSATAGWTGDLTVEYTFDPVDVPEPASWSIMGLGLAGAAAMRRRKRKKAVPAIT